MNVVGLACTVCFGGDGSSADAITASVLFLGGLTYGLLLVGGLLVVRARRRSNDPADKQPGDRR